MLTREDDIDVHALRRQGWTISAIARHLGKDRKIIRAYLSGREAGVRARGWPDPFDPFAAYCAQRLTDDPHLWASALFDELLGLGYDRSYPTMATRLSCSASDTVGGFSSRTSHPARRALSASARWVGSGVLSTTMSGVVTSLASSSSREEYQGASAGAAAEASGGRGSATADRSTTPLSTRSAMRRRCDAPCPCAPTRATFVG